MCSQNLPCAPPGEVREAQPQGCPSNSSFPEGEECWTLAAGAEWAWLGAHPSPLHTEKHPLLPMAVSGCSQPLAINPSRTIGECFPCEAHWSPSPSAFPLGNGSVRKQDLCLLLAHHESTTPSCCS